MNSQCILYACDAGYLLPTILSATQAATNSDRTRTDVLISLCDDTLPGGTVQALIDLCAQRSIRLHLTSVAVRERILALADDMRAAGRSVFDAMLLPFFIGEIVPPGYEDIVFIDGDTQIEADLSPLLGRRFDASRMLAVRDFCVLTSHLSPPWTDEKNAYYDRLGLSEAQRADYFNSGVLRATRATWQELTAAALEFYIHNKQATPLHDQCALNAVAKGRIAFAASRWNYPRHFLQHEHAPDQQPVIVHFMSNPRPWHGVYQPWDAHHYQRYVDLCHQAPLLRDYWPQLSVARKVLYRWRELSHRVAPPDWSRVDAHMLRKMFPDDAVA